MHESKNKIFLYQWAFNNYVDRFLPFFEPPLLCVDSFFTLSMGKNRHFLTPSPLTFPGSYRKAPYLDSLP